MLVADFEIIITKPFPAALMLSPFGFYGDILTLHPKTPLYNIIIIVDTVLRQKRNFKHGKQLSQQYRHIATLACMTKACPPQANVR